MIEFMKPVRGVFYLCSHCGDPLTSATKFCDGCRTKEQRAKKDAENKKHFEENGLVFNCGFCETEKKYKLVFQRNENQD